MCLNKRTFSLVVVDDPQKGLNDFNVGQQKNSLFTSYSSCINYKLSIEIMVLHIFKFTYIYQQICVLRL